MPGKHASEGGGGVFGLAGRCVPTPVSPLGRSLCGLIGVSDQQLYGASVEKLRRGGQGVGNGISRQPSNFLFLQPMARHVRKVVNPFPMLDPVKKKLRRLHQLLVNSRHALERTSRLVSTSWLGDLLFLLSARRTIMLNALDRELDQLHVPARPTEDATHHFEDFPGTGTGAKLYVEVCEKEEAYLVRELENLKLSPHLQDHTRDVIACLLDETRENMKDIGFLRTNHPALQN